MGHATTSISSSSAAAVLLLLAAAALLSSSASAFDITQILQQYPDYSQFNDLLSKTQLAGAINSRRTITVLAVSNDAIADITSRKADVQKRILSVHVVLDYYDQMKFSKLKGKSTFLTNLLQSTGTAQGRQGFITVARDPSGAIVFGPATRGSQVDARLLGVVAAQPFNVSVLHISHPLIPNGIDGNWSPIPQEQAAPPPPPPAVSDAPAESPVDDSVADGPVEEDASAPADAPVAEEPSLADSPSSDYESDDATADDASAAVKQAVSGAVVLGVLLIALL